jgi:hypothetical protein
MSRSRRAAVALTLAMFSAAHLRATVFLPSDLTDLVHAARAIAHGHILEVHAQASADRRRVDTLVTLQVVTYLKGNLGPSVTFRVPGGQVGRYRTVVLGAPTFTPGQEVVLLFGSRGPSVPYVLGLNQGVFRVVFDPATAARRIVPTPLVSEAAEWTRVVRGDPGHAPLLLSDFAGQVREILGSQEAGRSTER